ncbi:hypothetical protein G7Y89_g596 [Cudoniella acicularis]|uniref:Rhodopsin domain-containing protein n=1 Tax=Cudoniella acicularis TaxID=354080 RepID=A0A8H4WB18_9HELO|nr:hypothetical protein G7Y89_g596 [Cudoniella acicularis]
MDRTVSFTPQYLAADQSRTLANIGITFTVLEVVFILLFLTSRIRTKTANCLDTYLMTPAFFFCLMEPMACFYSIKYGGNGRHIASLTPKEIEIYLKCEIVVIFAYIPAVALPKLSILYLYLKIFTTKTYRYSVYSIAAIIIASLIASTVVACNFCTPFPFIWDKTIPGGHCLDQAKASIWVSFPNIITDLAMLVLPLPVVWKLHTSKNQKIGLTVTFLAFSLGLITSILRFANFFRMDEADSTWDITGMTWSTVEPGVYLIAACLPSLRSLFAPLIKKIDLRDVRTRFRRYGSGIASYPTDGTLKPVRLTNRSAKKGSSEVRFQEHGNATGLQEDKLSDGNEMDPVSCHRSATEDEDKPEKWSTGLESGLNLGIRVPNEYSISVTPRV